MAAVALRARDNWPVAAIGVVLVLGLAGPLLAGLSAPGFYVEVLLGGLMSGVLYSLVVLGFVLIFKASGVFNFAQGAMVLFAALAMARMGEVMPLWLAFLLAFALMAILAFSVERLVLRPLVNQDPVVLLMDEPFAALDAQTREFMQAELLKIWSHARKTVVFITHQINEAVFLADRVTVMSARPGRVKGVIDIPFDRPRSLSIKRDPRFLELEDTIWQMVEEKPEAIGMRTAS